MSAIEHCMKYSIASIIWSHHRSSLEITRESLVEGDMFERLCSHRSLLKTSGIESCIQLTLDDSVAI